MLKRTGDWDKVRRLVFSLQKELVDAKNTSLMRWGLKAEGIAKTHISLQDLNWKALRPEYLALKIRQGRSENILISSSSYFQSITSWKDRDTVLVGVKKEEKNAEGEVIADIAKVLEYGSESANIPARPLWQPTFKETIQWHRKKNMPETLFKDALKKYL